MKRKTKLQKTEEAFAKALQLIYEKKEYEAYNYIYSDLSVDIFDYANDLLDITSKEQDIIDIKKICKKVFDILDKFISDEEKELLTGNHEISEKEENLMLESFNDNIIEQKRKTLSPNKFADWFAEYTLKSDNILEIDNENDNY